MKKLDQIFNEELPMTWNDASFASETWVILPYWEEIHKPERLKKEEITYNPSSPSLHEMESSGVFRRTLLLGHAYRESGGKF